MNALTICVVACFAFVIGGIANNVAGNIRNEPTVKPQKYHHYCDERGGISDTSLDYTITFCADGDHTHARG